MRKIAILICAGALTAQAPPVRLSAEGKERILRAQLAQQRAAIAVVDTPAYRVFKFSEEELQRVILEVQAKEKCKIDLAKVECVEVTKP